MKRILILGAGAEQSIAIKQAKELGYYVIACDQNPNARGFLFADKAIVVDIKNVNKIIRVSKKLNIDGVFSHGVEIPHIVSKIAQNFNLPGLDTEVANLATNKIERINFLRRNGIPCADFTVAKNISELKDASKIIGFPLVLKPIDSSGSRGVQYVENPNELKLAYQNAIKYSDSKKVLLEEVLKGHEISTESVIFNGRIHTFAFADRNYSDSHSFLPYFIEDGINFPTKLSIEMQNKVNSLIEKTIRILGIDFGAAKGDVIIDNGIPKIIEMAARTSGGWFGAGSIPAATGCNALIPLLQMAVGDKPNMSMLNSTKQLGCSQRYVIPKIKGKVVKVSGENDAKNSKGVVLSEFFLPKVGDIIKPAESHADRFGQIICVAESRDKAVFLCKQAITKIKIEVENNG